MDVQQTLQILWYTVEFIQIRLALQSFFLQKIGRMIGLFLHICRVNIHFIIILVIT